MVSSLKKSELEFIVDTLTTALPKTLTIYIFGSVASGTASENSDLDIAFLSLDKPSGDVGFAVKSKLSSYFRRGIDLVDLARADVVTASQVITYGKPIFVSDSYKLGLYEVYVLPSYAQLNQERKEILDDINERGSIFG